MPAGVVVAPPRSWRRGYRFLGLRLPEPYRAWVADDLRSDAAVRRTMLARTLPLLPFAAVLLALVLGPDGNAAGAAGLIGTLVGLLLHLGLGVDRFRRGVLQWQRVDRDGEPVAPRGLARLSSPAAVLLNVAGLAAFALACWSVLST